ncbi:MAG: DUF2851 family protein [Verrucomicrobiota bacterium]
MTVSPLQKKFYAAWRAQQGSFASLREASSPLPERLLQIIWHHQRLLRDQLKTLDGKTVRILHPGFWNHEAGPDFWGAVLQIDGEAAVTGDVEIDLREEGWRQHGHEGNPNFANVILHVIWETEGAPQLVTPTLALKPFLDAPLNELCLWLGSEGAQKFPAQSAGQCCAPLRDLLPEKMDALLQEAAGVRLQVKANDFQARARRAGWELALWEGIFRALGYKQNIWPMQRLAEVLPRAFGKKTTPLFWQAWLLGVGGLLPTQPEKTGTEIYLREIWDIWWRERDSLSDVTFPRSVWRFHGMRPANLPQRRLALASHWLADLKFFSKLEKWFLAPTASPLSSLSKLLQIKDDEFWSWHWTFRSARLAQPQLLIGTARITDLAINVILPWFWMRAVAGKNEKLRERAEQIYFAWPAGEDNSILRLARQRLLGGLARRRLPTAAAQQGLLQVVKDFCAHTNALCTDCRFPDLVRSWNLEK